MKGKPYFFVWYETSITVTIFDTSKINGGVIQKEGCHFIVRGCLYPFKFKKDMTFYLDNPMYQVGVNPCKEGLKGIHNTHRGVYNGSPLLSVLNLPFCTRL